jgi:hypothetical protein
VHGFWKRPASFIEKVHAAQPCFEHKPARTSTVAALPCSPAFSHPVPRVI